MIRILLLARYGRLGASSRLRMLQYVPYLMEHDFEVVVEPLLDNAYIEAIYRGRKVSATRVIAAYGRRVRSLAGARDFDALWVEKESLPWLPAFVEHGLIPGGLPCLVDYDDAVFHRYDAHSNVIVRTVLGRKIDAVMAGASVVTVGNRYLADRARRAGARRVEILPTVVDASRYPVGTQKPDGKFTIGWIGTPITTPYVLDVLAAIRNVGAQTNARLVLVGAGAETFDHQGMPIEILPWNEESEARDVASFDVGIMPLRDGPFERGKCGYKLIQYMASGIPVVASPVGVNAEIVETGVNGYLADSPAEWTEALMTLAQDPQRAAALGAAGRRKVEVQYDVAVTAPRVAALLRDVVSGAGVEGL